MPTEPNWDASSDAAWKHIEELKRIGQSYLDETAHHYPKIYSLPIAHFKTVNEPVVMAGKGGHRCGAEARIENNIYGAKAPSFDEIACGRPLKHDGNHVSTFQEKLPFRKRWRISTWEQVADDTESVVKDTH